MNRERELWGMVLWIEAQHGDRAPDYIFSQIKRLADEIEMQGISLWFAVSDRYEQLAIKPQRLN